MSEPAAGPIRPPCLSLRGSPSHRHLMGPLKSPGQPEFPTLATYAIVAICFLGHVAFRLLMFPLVLVFWAWVDNVPCLVSISPLPCLQEMYADSAPTLLLPECADFKVPLHCPWAWELAGKKCPTTLLPRLCPELSWAVAPVSGIRMR